MSEPNGGIKDSNAPEFLPAKTLPQNRSTNFKKNKIEIGFNEFIQVKSQSVIITPAIVPKPSITVSGKKIVIVFNKPLPENTTFTINLSGAVTDITENNIVENLQYVFSTGPFLDSLQLKGRVVDAYSRKPLTGITLVLHNSEYDSAIYKNTPSYFLKSDVSGNFTFNNLKNGSYNVYGIYDKNADLKFNGYPEDISFFNTSIVLDSNKNTENLLIFKPEPNKIQLKNSNYVSAFVQHYSFNTPIKNLTAHSSMRLNKYSNNNDSTLIMALTDTTIKDTVKFMVNGENFSDTLNFTAHLSKKANRNLKLSSTFQSDLYSGDSLVIRFNMPFEVDEKKIELIDTLHKSNHLFTFIKRDLSFVIFPKVPEEKTPVTLNIYEGAFVSTVNKSKNLKQVERTMLLPDDKCGSIIITFRNDELKKMTNARCLLKLEKQVIGERALLEKLEFEKLKPGTYTIGVYDDINNNKQWSSGNFEKKIQPEKIIWFNQAIKVKSNWQQDIVWM